MNGLKFDNEDLERFPDLGQLVDDTYFLVRGINRGGMGIVYLAKPDMDCFDYASVLAYRTHRLNRATGIIPESRADHFRTIEELIDELKKPQDSEEATHTRKAKIRRIVETEHSKFVPSKDELVAVKILDIPAGAHNVSGLVERFEAERRLLMGFDFKEIVRVYGGGIARINGKSKCYYAMEFLDMVDIENPSEKEVITIGMLAANGLVKLHDNGIVHRDIKPGNIVRTKDGRVLLTDVGIAKDQHRKTQLTMEGSVLGSPAYMSPEQASGLELDGRTDIYSLGATLYEYLTGDVPYPGDYTHIMQLIDTIRNPDVLPVPISERRPTVSEGLVQVIDKMMAKNPDDRYQTAREVVTDLYRILNNQRTSIMIERESEESEERELREAERKKRRREQREQKEVMQRQRAKKMGLIGGVAATFLVGALGLYGLFGGSKPVNNGRESSSSTVVSSSTTSTEVQPTVQNPVHSIAQPAPVEVQPTVQNPVQNPNYERLYGNYVSFTISSDILSADITKIIESPGFNLENVDKLSGRLNEIQAEAKEYHGRGIEEAGGLVKKLEDYKPKLDEVRKTIKFNRKRLTENSDVIFEGGVLNMPFDEGTVIGQYNQLIAQDLSGNGNHGIVYGARQVDGVRGKALEFDGENDYIEILDSSSLDIQDALTISSWIYINKLNNWSNIVRKGFTKREGLGGAYDLALVNNNIRLGINDTNWTFPNTSSLPVNEWAHVVATYDGSTRRFYVNGVLQNELTEPRKIRANDQNLTIGQNGNMQGYFNGRLDELAIFNRALSVKEVEDLYRRKK